MGIAITLVSIGGLFFVWKFTSKSTIPTVSNIIIGADEHIRGNKKGSITLVEYSDFQCPTCGLYYSIVKQVIEKNKDNLRYVYRHFPLTDLHKNAKAAARAAEAAGAQGKFFEFHDQLFEHQKDWSTTTNPDELFLKYAKKLNLDLEKFKKDKNDGGIAAKVDKDYDSGLGLGVQGTPTFFLNGVKIELPGPFEEFDKLIKQAQGQSPLPTSTKSEKVHKHADLAVYIDNRSLDFTLSRYQSTEEKPLNPAVHMHDGNGEVVHIHKEKIVLGDFFASIGMKLDKNCLKLDTGQNYCNNNKKTLKLLVNGVANDKFANYEINDLDRILVSFGKETGEELKNQIESVTDRACIYSEKCPERGEPPTENCVGGLDTGC